MQKVDINKLYEMVKSGKNKRFDEVEHCKLILKIMTDPKKGTLSAFCVEAGVGDGTFYGWLNKSELFFECYALGKMYAREVWEQDGLELREEIMMPGATNNKLEHWKMMGWSRFGISKNSRIRLDLNANDSPDKHYSQLMKQACNGDFTAGEIKQLMEAINVGLNTHQVFALQKEIDQLKSDLATMYENSNGHDTSAVKRAP